MTSSFAATTRIQVRPEQVFWFLADPATAPVIDPAVISYEPVGGAMGLGVENRIRMRLLGVPVTIASETVEWEPGRRMVFRSIRPARPVVAIATHQFDGDGRGGTTYTWSFEFVPTGSGGRVTAKLGKVLFERNARAQQERVRVSLEAALRPPPPPHTSGS